MTSRFLSFCIVGASAFVVDTVVYYYLAQARSGSAFLPKLLSFLAAVVYTYLLNRSITFRRTRVAIRARAFLIVQFCRYVLGQSIGAIVNLFVFVIARAFGVPTFPSLAAAATSGLVVNYMAAALALDR